VLFVLTRRAFVDGCDLAFTRRGVGWQISLFRSI
jgi:hypothetical protein